MGVPKGELASIAPSGPSAGIREPEPSNLFAARVPSGFSDTLPTQPTAEPRSDRYAA